VDYLSVALNAMKSQNLDARSALQAAETQAVADQQAAIAQKSKVTLRVTAPTSAPAVAAGKITLNFDVSMFSPTLNIDAITKVARDFAVSDPQVGSVNVVQSRDDFDKIADSSDCFYLGYNAVPAASLDKVISLDSFMAADPAFDKGDFVGNILTAVQRDNKTWALPLQIEPMILQYDADRFAKAGLTMPTEGWTVNNFIDALKALKNDLSGQAPFVTRGDVTSGADGTELLILIADYGGVPLDYRTNPATINFTDPATVNAIQQVLDLAKKGYMTYSPLGQSPDPETRFGQPDHTAAIYPDALTAVSMQQDSSKPSAYKPALYPKGTKYTGFGYIVDTGYISTQAKAPEACYRWLSTLAKHAEVFAGMPARHSMIAGLKGVANPDLLNLYNNADALLKDSNTIPIATLNPLSISISDLLNQYWLYQAFDSYVLHDANLESALKDAEGYAKTFQGCIVNLPVLALSSQFADKDSTNAYIRCAEKADTRLKPILDPLIR
jgi:ABC-type glycerol-3-phosphate transport system substrate-binding protein